MQAPPVTQFDQMPHAFGASGCRRQRSRNLYPKLPIKTVGNRLFRRFCKVSSSKRGPEKMIPSIRLTAPDSDRYQRCALPRRSRESGTCCSRTAVTRLFSVWMINVPELEGGLRDRTNATAFDWPLTSAPPMRSERIPILGRFAARAGGFLHELSHPGRCLKSKTPSCERRWHASQHLNS